MELTILMPCLNEAETLAKCIDKAKSFLQRENIQGEILIADNGSADGSQSIAESRGARVVHVTERGYGAALHAGIQQAEGRYIIMGDADDSYDFLNLKPFVAELRAGADLVMGNRFKGKIEQGAMPFLNKYLGNPVLSLLGRVFFRSSIGDFHCGLRGFKKKSIELLNLQAKGMEFASEMIAKASLQSLRITEVPTVLALDGRSRRPHLRPWRDGWRHLRLLLLLCPRWLFLYPGLFFVALGTGCLSILFAGPVNVGNLTFDIHTMLFGSLFTLVGLQTIFFFIFTRVLSLPKIKLSLEYGLILGTIVTIIGILGAGYCVLEWKEQGFGDLLPTEMMRLAIPSFTVILAGVQIIFSSFFASVLQMSKQH